MNKVFDNTNKVVYEFFRMTLCILFCKNTFITLSCFLASGKYKNNLVTKSCIYVVVLRLKVIFDILLLRLLNGENLQLEKSVISFVYLRATN